MPIPDVRARACVRAYAREPVCMRACSCVFR